MSTAPVAPSPERSGLPRPFVALCVAIGVLVGAYAVLTLLSLATASTEHRARTFAAVDALRIDSGSGDVTVIGERRDDIRVELEIQRGMWRGAWQPDVELTSEGRALRLGSDCSLWAHIGVSDCGAAFTVRVPRGTRVEIAVSSGDATVRDVAAAVTVRADSGDLRAERVRGPLDVSASSGDVEVDGFRGLRLLAAADSGDVRVTALRAPRLLRAHASSGDVAVAVPDVAYRVVADADSGDRTVLVRHDPAARRTIEASASSGDVTVVPLGRSG